LEKGAQPLVPRYINTRSDVQILGASVGRVVPVLRQIPETGNAYTFEQYVKIVAVEIVPARSDKLKSFIVKKVKAGGLRRERAEEQWAAAFDV